MFCQNTTHQPCSFCSLLLGLAVVQVPDDACLAFVSDVNSPWLSPFRNSTLGSSPCSLHSKLPSGPHRTRMIQSRFSQLSPTPASPTVHALELTELRPDLGLLHLLYPCLRCFHSLPHHTQFSNSCWYCLKSSFSTHVALLMCMLCDPQSLLLLHATSQCYSGVLSPS